MEELLDNILNRLDHLESLFSRRLLEDKVKNNLIEEVKTDLAYRRSLDTGLALEALTKDLVQVIDRLMQGEPSHEFNESIIDELLSILELRGLRLISEREQLDPKVHEVVEVVPTAVPENHLTIVDVIQPGYHIDKKLLRPSKVIVYQYDGSVDYAE